MTAVRLADAIAWLEILRPIAKTIPIIGTSLEGGIETVIAICNAAQVAQSESSRRTETALRASKLYIAIFYVLKDYPPSMRNEKRSLLEDVIVVLRDTSQLMASRSTQRRIWRAMTHKSFEQQLVDLQQRLSRAAKDFDLATLIHVDASLEKLTLVVREINRAVEKMQPASDLEFLEKRLKPLHAAAHYHKDAPPRCLANTRVKLMESILHWTQDPDLPAVFWLSGLAGTGKTAVAQELCSELHARPDHVIHVVSFFFSRRFDDRKSVDRAATTLMWELARVDANACSAMASILTREPELTEKGLPILAEKLVAPALRVSSAPLVIVIDALDEADQAGGYALQEFLLGLGACLSSRTKLFVTSRHTRRISLVFAYVFGTGDPPHLVDGRSPPRPPNYPDRHLEFKLHEIERNTVNSDIRAFVRDRFAAITERHAVQGNFDLTAWPSAADVDEVVRRADRLFVYASTVCRYIDHDNLSPRRLLESLLRPFAQATRSSSPYRELDKLYLQILCDSITAQPTGNSPPSPASSIGSQPRISDEEALSSSVRLILALALLKGTQLKRRDIACLVARDAYAVGENANIIDSLATVLMIEPESPVRTFHPSFPAFVFSRCVDRRFRVSAAEPEADITQCCLRLLNWGFPSDSSLPSVQWQPENGICTDDALMFACKNWFCCLSKLLPSGIGSTPVAHPDRGWKQAPWIDDLRMFCNTRLIAWVAFALTDSVPGLPGCSELAYNSLIPVLWMLYANAEDIGISNLWQELKASLQELLSDANSDFQRPLIEHPFSRLSAYVRALRDRNSGIRELKEFIPKVLETTAAAMGDRAAFEESILQLARAYWQIYRYYDL